jgi:ABC-type polysaccharide/polyol phosphate export permease
VIEENYFMSSKSVFWREAWVITAANLMSRFRGTVSGFFWVILNPLVMYFAQGFVFKMVIYLHVENYWIFLLSGLLPWIFIVQSFDMCTTLLFHSGSMMKAYQVNPLVFIFAQIIDNAFNFFVAMVVVLTLLSVAFEIPYSRLWLFPIAVIPLTIFVTSTSLIFATLFVFFRDIKFIVSFAMNVLFFLTPIFYPLSLMPEQFRWLVRLNPMYWIISPFQDIFSRVPLQTCAESLVMATLVSTGFAAIAYFVWKTKRNQVLFYVYFN